MILLVAALGTGLRVQAQEGCAPRPLPWFEDFESGFVSSNGWVNTTLDSTYFEYDGCWTHFLRHYPGWRSLISFEYFNVQNPPPIRNNLLHLEKAYWDFNGVEPGEKWAATPPCAESPTQVTLWGFYHVWVFGTELTDPMTDTLFAAGVPLGIGYIADEADPMWSYVPLDTVYITSRVGEAKSFRCSDLRGTVVPPPCRLAFRVAEPMDTWRGNVTVYLDSITVATGTLHTDTTVDYRDTLCAGLDYAGHGFSPGTLDQPGTYTFTRTECTDTAALLHRLTLTVLPVADTVLHDTLTPGDTLWVAGNAITAAGTYRFRLTAGNGCDSTVTLHLASCLPVPCLALSRDFIDYDHPVVTFTDCTEGSTHSLWRMSNGTTLTGQSVRHQFRHPLPDSLTVSLHSCNRHGCCADTTFPLPLHIRSVWFPNTFTPGAEDNNRFGCVTSVEATAFELTVFNRRGMKVYTTADPAARWDGTLGGNPLPQGTYLYQWHIKDSHGLVKNGAGTITLIR